MCLLQQVSTNLAGVRGCKVIFTSKVEMGDCLQFVTFGNSEVTETCKCYINIPNRGNSQIP